jgi:hypothetical protein
MPQLGSRKLDDSVLIGLRNLRPRSHDGSPCGIDAAAALHHIGDDLGGFRDGDHVSHDLPTNIATGVLSVLGALTPR